MKWLDKIKQTFYHYLEIALLGPRDFPDLDMEEVMYDSIEDASWHTEKTGKNLIALQFQDKHWAPGVWAGTEGWVFGHTGLQYRVVEIDFELQVVTVERIK